MARRSIWDCSPVPAVRTAKRPTSTSTPAGFFGSATLATGDRPALTDGTESATDGFDDAADLFGAETRVDGGEENGERRRRRRSRPRPRCRRRPLGDLVREIRAKQAAREEGADAAIDADLFEPVEVDEVDDEVVWEAFTAEETGTEEQVGLGADPEETSPDGEAVVPKRQFCQRCPHFTDPRRRPVPTRGRASSRSSTPRTSGCGTVRSSRRNASPRPSSELWGRDRFPVGRRTVTADSRP
ncbi:hypothetical protein ACFQL0_18455 [Haloplanus litoreus]|uniref:hypothetical protein n=1 Tax=Haloplanus litoreus TaxID=767515 RepID=UPI00361821B2